MRVCREGCLQAAVDDLQAAFISVATNARRVEAAHRTARPSLDCSQRALYAGRDESTLLTDGPLLGHVGLTRAQQDKEPDTTTTANQQKPGQSYRSTDGRVQDRIRQC